MLRLKINYISKSGPDWYAHLGFRMHFMGCISSWSPARFLEILSTICYPHPPSAPMGIVVVSCVRLSWCLSVRLQRRYRPNITAPRFSVMSEWCTVTWSRSLFKWPCSAIFARFVEHRNFPRGTIALYKCHLSAWNLIGWCTVPRRRWLFKMAMIGQFLHIQWNFKNFHDMLGPGPLENEPY